MDVAPSLRWDVGSPVNSIAISHNGRLVASGSTDCFIRIWDAHTGYLVQGPLKGHTHWVRSVAWSHDDTRVVSGSSDDTVRIWDVRTGASIGKPSRGHTSAVFSVAFSPDSAFIVSGSYDSTIRIWNARTGAPTGYPLRGHTSAVFSVAFSSDGTRVVSGSSDNTIRIWDTRTGFPIGYPLRGHTDAVLSVAFSPDNTSLVSGSADETVRIWNVRTGTPIGDPLKGHTSAVLSASFSHDSSIIVSGSKDKTIGIWDARTGAPIGEALNRHTGTVYSVAFSCDGTRLLSGSGDKTICVWRTTPNNPSFDRVSSDMSIEEMFECLVQYGCADLSTFLGNGEYSSLPIENGGFGDVWRVTLAGRTLNESPVLAVKTLRLKTLLEGNNKAAKRAAREVHHWSKLRHPNVQQLLGIVIFKGGLGMVSSWWESGHLKGYLADHPEVPRHPLCIQLASGVSYLHSVDMVHGDLKANNVLVSDDGTLKINDFDHAVLAESALRFSTTTRTGGGTLRWMAPELLQSDEDDEDDETQPEAVRCKETDIYALGMTLLEIVTGNVPYHEYQQDMGVFHAIDARQPPRRPQQLAEPELHATSMWELLLRCWDHEPSARPHAESVLASLNSFAV